VKVFILDTSAILSGFIGEVMLAPMKVYDELKKFKDQIPEHILAYYEETLRFYEPKKECVEKVKEIAEKTGDIHRLSETDIEVIALALEHNGIVVTNDLSIQNVCEELNIGYMSYLSKDIKRVFEWEVVCKSCGKVLDKKYDKCPFCGGDVGFRIRRSRNLKKK